MKIKYKIVTPRGDVERKELNCDEHGLTEEVLDQLDFNKKRQIILQLIHRIQREKYGTKCEVELL